MSQFYPQPSPFYPPEQSLEDEYYDEGDFEYEIEEDEDYYAESSDTLVQRILLFCAGGCLVFLCMGCCGLLGIGLWALDPGSSLVSIPIPGSDIGLSFDDPAFPGESVVNEQAMKLAILEVNRNASLPNIPIVEGREIIVVTIELVNLGDEDANFNERDFVLLNRFEEAYAPTSGSIDGALGRGVLPADTGLEGRLVFEVIAGEFDLMLVWDRGPDSEPRYMLLE